MLKKILVLLLLVQIIFSTTSFGWGSKGHDIIAEIATRHLTPKAKKEVDKILNGKSMVYYSSWMDQIRSIPQYKHTSPYHYVNVDEGEEYTPTEIEDGGDVYTAIMESIAILANKEITCDSTLNFHLKALIHFVGDMHCPMHAGRKSDLGGNKFSIKWFGKATRLHSLWDSGLIESSKTWSYSEWADNIDFGSSKANFNKYCTTTPLEWMEETVEVASEVYKGVEVGGNYSYDYINDNYELLEEQLRRAGYRLAFLLNSIY